MMQKATLLLISCLSAIAIQAKDYSVNDFGVRNDGMTLSTNSIQYAINHIHNEGGGRLIFPGGGTYLTGSVYLLSGVTLHLENGATILGSNNPLDYDKHGGWPAIIFGINQKNVGVTGWGEINGQGWALSQNVMGLVHRGVLKDDLKYDRPAHRPQNIFFLDCDGVIVRDITLRAPGDRTNSYERCKNVFVQGIRVDGNSFWNNDGINIVDCDGVDVRDCWFDAADDVICLKSHNPNYTCQNVVIDNCVGRSSANGVKFGAVSRGGFKHIKITNITIYNTYRSAVTFAAVDGAEIEDITIDGLRSINTGNVFFFTIGDRWAGGKQPYMRDITIKNVYAEVPPEKPDPNYPFEGPIEDLPRNICPSVITGRTDIPIERMTFENIEIVYPGGGDPFYAKVGTDELDKVPEMPTAYPEFSMYKELPAWGFYIRHARDITFKNVTMTAVKPDYRPGIVTDDVEGLTMINTRIIEPGVPENQQTFFRQTSGITVK